ncbi:MAG: DNA topoisomerase IV subunit A [Thermoanaerobaculales bacterium]|jgi:topoisomerase-4 subunit A|nr:DNA topoisomerase IV subunit A [Thermoanaerobaculales bacterium]
MTRVKALMGQNFIEYASYVILDRAIPDVRDGFKPVQRRILASLAKMDDGKFHKVANVIGDTMKLHPHGDASIGDALVVLANKDYFIERQGNFGNIVTGHSAAAPRYIECRLTDLAKDTLFNKALTEYRPSYDGRNDEPVVLPAKLPVLLLMGAEGIAVGMSTRILPHNFTELLEAQIAILNNEPLEILPDFATGGLMDVSEYEDGLGKVRVRARIESKDKKTVVIREIPPTTTTEGLISSMESASQKGKLKIGSIDDFTTDAVEIEVGLPRGVYADEVIPQLFAHTDCEVSISANMVMIKDDRPAEIGVSEVLCYLTDRLRGIIKSELELELGQLEDKKHWLDLERIFIENRIYKRIEDATTAEQVRYEVRVGLEPFLPELDREVSDDDVERLLKIPIRRISQYDIDKNRRDISDTLKAIKATRGKLRRLTQTTITWLEEILEKYGERWPRRTEITTFETVDVRAVARQNLKLSYESETGFFGTAVKGDRFSLTVSEYDRILLISKDGTYRVVSPEEKIFVPGKVIWAGVLDPDEGRTFTVVYRNWDRMTYGKKVHIRAFIKDREYRLVKDENGKIDYLIEGDSDDLIHMDFVPAKRQRVHEADFDLAELEFKGITAIGRRLAPKPVARMKKMKRGDTPLPEPEKAAEPEAEEQPGLFGDEEQ